MTRKFCRALLFGSCVSFALPAQKFKKKIRILSGVLTATKVSSCHWYRQTTVILTPAPYISVKLAEISKRRLSILAGDIRHFSQSPESNTFLTHFCFNNFALIVCPSESGTEVGAPLFPAVPLSLGHALYIKR
jgi:hypothetical protein